MLNNQSSIREMFPFLKKFTYIDSAHYTPYSQRVVDKINEFIISFTHDYLNLSKFHIEMSMNLRETCGRLINTSPENIIITSNTTHGINIFANGINLEPDDNNVAYLDSEFPAIVYPWMNQEHLGKVKAFVIPSSKGYVNDTVLKKSLLENNIRVLTLSYVQFLGYKYNIKSIGEFCRKNNIFLVVDAMQAAAICPIDVEDMYIDYLCTGNQKWMMSPAGTGFTYISKAYREYVRPTYVGTTNVNYDFDNFLKYELGFIPDSRAFENSTLNTLGMIGMNEALTHFMELGIDNIYNHIIEVQDYFINKLDDSKYRVESDLSSEHRSNILIFTHIDNQKNKSVLEHLNKNEIFIALREGYLRLSPHIYNNTSDIDKLISCLNTF